MWRILALSAIFTSMTCGDLDEFTLNKTATTRVQGSATDSLPGDLGFEGLVDFDLAGEDVLNNANVTREEIDSVYLRQITLTIPDDSPGRTFDFLDTLEFFAEAQGLERVRIAGGRDFAPGMTVIGLDVADVNLADYAAAPSLTISSESAGRPPEEDTDIRAELELDIDVNVAELICSGAR